MVSKIKTAVEMLYFWSHIPPQFPSCCLLPPAQFKHNPNFGLPVHPSLSCDSSFAGRPRDPTNQLPLVSSNLSAVFQQNRLSSPGVKWQHLVTLSGSQVVHPAYLARTCDHTFHSQLLLRTLNPQPKNVVV